MCQLQDAKKIILNNLMAMKQVTNKITEPDVARHTSVHLSLSGLWAANLSGLRAVIKSASGRMLIWYL